MKTRSFQYQFKFLKNLLEFAAQGSGPTKKRFTFLSSIAAVARIGLGNTGTPIAEEPVAPADGACGIGYADGKLVCEKILERAAETYAGQLEITSVRCGQMTGAKNTGVWNSNEQIPMLLRSAQTLGSLPKLEGVSLENIQSRKQH
jgi:thioester reductase-like protein